jgi:hypothetical protein
MLAWRFVFVVLAVSQASLPDRWSLETRGLLPQAIAINQGDPRYLFVALKTGGVAVYRDAHAGKPPARVAVVSRRELGNLDAMHLFQRGDTLFVALGDFFAAFGSRAGVAALDVSDPAAPRVASRWISPQSMKGAAAVVADERHVYVGAMTKGLLIFDAGDPARLTHVSTFLPDVNFPRPRPNAIQHPNARGLAISGDRLFVADDAGGLRVVDVSNRARPREIGRYINESMRSKQQAYNNLVLDGRRAYVAVDYAGLEIIDIADPERMRQVGWWNPWKAETPANTWFNSPGHTNQIAFDPARKLVYLSAGDSELQVVDVSDPAAPRLAASHGSPRNNRGTWGVTLGDDAVYLTYIQTLIPFRGTWSGIVALGR